jgi:3-hydroxyisobutyrate dehydrogenase
MHAISKVAVLGLGLMGTGMAGRLLEKGFDVTVYNRNPDKAAPLAERGAKMASTPREAVHGALYVISMVADDNASRSIWLGENGALAGAIPGANLIESSTVSPPWIRELGIAALAQKCELIDAPVTGSKPQAAAGQLLFLVGGSERALERCRPVLAAMSRDIVHLGPVGSGAQMKLINNFVCGVQMVAIAEALTLIERTGLDPGAALAVLTEGAPGSPLVKVLSQRMLKRDFTPNFLLKLMAKDLGYAIEEGRAYSLPLATTAAALGVMRKALDAGLGDEDFSAVVELLRQSNQPAAQV